MSPGRRIAGETDRVLPAFLDFSWSTDRSADDGGHVTLRFTDEASRIILSEVRVPVHEFAYALSSQAGIPCSYRSFTGGEEKIGKRHENMTVVVPGLGRGGWPDRFTRDSMTQAAIEDQGLGVWPVSGYDYGTMGDGGENFHRRVRGKDGAPDGYQVTLHRFVDPETGEVVP